MNLWSRVASTLLAVASLCLGQTSPANSPAAAQAAPSGAPAASAPVPDITVTGPKATVVEPAQKETPEPRPLQPPATATPAPPMPAGANDPVASPNTPPKRITAPKSGADSTATGSHPAAIDSPRYVLGPNDVVQVAVWGDKNFTGVYAIGPDGMMSLPLLTDFKAVGLTTVGLKDLITEKLQDYIKEPEVNVQLLRNNSKKYTMIGGVARTGAFPLMQETTILDALAAAGGFKDFSNLKKIYLLRGTKQYPFNYKDVIAGKHMEQNIMIQDGDIIVVPD